jgi:hypothetical protein
MNECKDCKHEGQKCQDMRMGYCGSFTPKPIDRPQAKPFTPDEILELDRILALENTEFCINNRNQVTKAIKLALQNDPEDRRRLEIMLLSSVQDKQALKEKEIDLLQGKSL